MIQIPFRRIYEEFSFHLVFISRISEGFLLLYIVEKKFFDDQTLSPFLYQRWHHHMDGIHMMLCLCSPLLTCVFPAGPRVCARHMRFTIQQAPCVIYILQHFYGLKIRLQYIQPFPTFVFVPFINLFF